MRIRQAIAGTAIALATMGASGANAATVFSDYASWSGAVSGTTTVTIPDPAPDPFVFFPSGSVTYDGVVFSTSSALSDGNFFNIGSVYSGLAAVLSSQEQTIGIPNILITLPSSVTGFSLNYGTFDGSDVIFTLSNGDTFTQGSTATGDYVVPGFFGVTDTAFNSVLVTASSVNDLQEVLSLNNVVYAAAVPEPTTWAMFLVGFAGIGFMLRTRRRGAVAAG
jgi:hypothetical protein